MNNKENDNKKKREYTKSEIILGNTAIVSWILLGTVACWLFFSIGSMGYFALMVFLVYYELGKKGCLNCYYCKTCTIGVGKLPDFFFSKNGTTNVNRKALKLFPLVYSLLTAVPIVLFAVSIIQESALYKIALLGLLLMFSLYSGLVRKKTLFK